MKIMARIVAVAGLILWQALFSTNTYAKELQVGPGRSYVTITMAMVNAVTGDVIKVWPGLYEETVIFKQGVTIEGTDRQNVKIRGAVVLASDVVLKDVKIEGSTYEQVVISGSNIRNVKLVGVDVIGGGYYSLTEQLILLNNASRILIYDCELTAMDANCLLIRNGSFDIVIMRSGFAGRQEYRLEVKTLLVINDARRIKVFSNSFFKERGWHPAWRGNPILSGININRAWLINNIFYADVDNDPVQYGYNGLWIERSKFVTIEYNVFYQTGLYGVVPFSRQHHFIGPGIHISKVIEGDPTVDPATNPAVDSGSPSFPRDPDFTLADIGKEIFMQYDNLFNR